ncbi:coiled-coil domain-containing protein [Arthrobacter sp. H14-L1]|uniref:coiled-coil domain-containing protein n=1 Tax=Arthrobacter sp. H14-L1 TaxID=2996697 RepID=UPI00226D6435|nr:lytic transglycosylase domain-containing protein [Arthrobacter sp. H14-L1]MCY0904729.1 lytic transglycosylase domain-containing protein [Arthrobacter sp. H14-L1]
MSTAALLAAVLLSGAVLPVALAGRASADEATPPSGFPTWQDVQTAKQNESAKASEITRINALLDGLQGQADQLGNAAVRAGASYAEAKAGLDSASATVDLLAAKAQSAGTVVAQYKKEAGTLAAQSYKSGGSSLGLFAALDALGSKDGLQRLDVLGIVTDRTTALYNKSTAAQGTATSLADQEKVARAERERLAGEAQHRLDDAAAARSAVQAQVLLQQQQSVQLVAALASLKDSTVATEDQYRQGQVAMAVYEAAQQAKRAAAEEQARQKAAAAAAATQLVTSSSAPSPAGTGGSGPPRAPASGTSGSPDGGSTGSSGYIPVNVLLPNIPGNQINDPAGAKAYASARLGANGWGQDQFPCLVQLWIQESGWLTNATNQSSGAYGIAQALLPSKYGSQGSDWLTSYRTQIDWGLGYIRDRYGSPCGAWDHEVSHNWY